MKAGLRALNAITDTVLAYRPKSKTKKAQKATKTAPRKKFRPKRRG